MIKSVMNLFFGCGHQRTTFPLTPARRSAIPGSNYSGEKRNHGTYVVCLDCGKEFAYNWREMRLGKAVEPLPAKTVEPVASHQ
jgi:hypothetical protein